MKTAEELRQEAQELENKAREMEREAQRKKRDEEISARLEAENKIYAALAAKIVAALNDDGVKASVKMYERNWRQGQSYIEIANSGWGSLVEIGLSTSRYSDHLLGVYVKVGSYGENPHTWKAKDVDALKTDGIVKAVKSRLADRAARAKQIADRDAAYKLAAEIEKSNEGLRDKVTVPKECGYVYIQPSRSKRGCVTFKFEHTFNVTPERASALLLALRDLIQ